MRRIVPVLAISLMAIFATGCDSDDDDLPTLFADLTGDTEVPNPGDPDGEGEAVVTLDPETGEVCYDITVSGVDQITAAHIHEGAAGVAGGVVIGFSASTGPLNGCVTGVDIAQINEILDTPSNFYVNVHNNPYPGGALRGQLEE